MLLLLMIILGQHKFFNVVFYSFIFGCGLSLGVNDMGTMLMFI